MAEQPETIGRYEVETRIAHGGQGTLYKAYDRRLNRHVAIKLLREPDDEDLCRRFERESRAVASLNHPNIVTVFEVGEYNGQPFMAMEYIDGRTLTSIIDSHPLPSIVRRLELMEALCDGLAFAHRLAVIHRDIKPANLMVRADGRLKIVDFGIARAAADPNLTQAGRLVGTVNYMSPEQVRGLDLDGRSDMFAVGAVFYELLSGRQAFPGTTHTAVLNRILHEEPEPLEVICPDLDPAIWRIVRRAIERDPDQRFTDLRQMGLEIARARESLDDTGASVIGAPLDANTVAPAVRRRGTDLEEIARRRTQQIDASLTRAQEALSAGRFDEAIAQCEEVLVIDPSSSSAHTIADRARLERDEASAREYLSRAEDELRKGELTAAAQAVRDSLTLMPDAADALELARVIREARVAREREAQNAARLVAERQRDEHAHQTAAEAQRLFDGGDHAEAMAVLEGFSPAHPTVSRLWVTLSAASKAAESVDTAPPEPDQTGRTTVSPVPAVAERTPARERSVARRSIRLAAVAIVVLAAVAAWLMRGGSTNQMTAIATGPPAVGGAVGGAGTGGTGGAPDLAGAVNTDIPPNPPRKPDAAAPPGNPVAPRPAPIRPPATSGEVEAAQPTAASTSPVTLPSTTGPAGPVVGPVVLQSQSGPLPIATAPPTADRQRPEEPRLPIGEKPGVDRTRGDQPATVTPSPVPAERAREPALPPVARPAPVPSPVTDDERIRRTLAAYTQAFGRRDVDAVMRVYPNASRADVVKAFVDVLEFTMEINVLRVRTDNGGATVTAHVRQWIRKAKDQRRGTQSDLEFQMRRAGDDWIISAIGAVR